MKTFHASYAAQAMARKNGEPLLIMRMGESQFKPADENGLANVTVTVDRDTVTITGWEAVMDKYEGQVVDKETAEKAYFQEELDEAEKVYDTKTNWYGKVLSKTHTGYLLRGWYQRRKHRKFRLDYTGKVVLVWRATDKTIKREMELIPGPEHGEVNDQSESCGEQEFGLRKLRFPKEGHDDDEEAGGVPAPADPGDAGRLDGGEGDESEAGDAGAEG